MKHIKLLFISLCALIYGAGCYYYPPNTINGAQGVLEDKGIKTLVDQLPESSQLMGSGSGFLVTNDGYLITNHHVVYYGNRFLIKTENGCFEAKLIKVDNENDLALLKINGSFSALPLLESKNARLGQEVYTVGFPNISLQGLSPKLTKGSISSTTGMHDDPRFFQISVPVQPGNSGGALCNEHGNVVGVVSGMLLSTYPFVNFQNVNYAIKSTVAIEFLSKSPASSKIISSPSDLKPRADAPGVMARTQNAAALILVYQTPEESKGSNDDSLALEVLENWLGLIDSSSFSDAWRLTSANLKASTTQTDYISKMTNIRRLFGKSISRRLLEKRKIHGRLEGNSTVENSLMVRFKASCENAPEAVETIILSQEKDGQWCVSNYTIQ